MRACDICSFALQENIIISPGCTEAGSHFVGNFISSISFWNVQGALPMRMAFFNEWTVHDKKRKLSCCNWRRRSWRANSCLLCQGGIISVCHLKNQCTLSFLECERNRVLWRHLTFNNRCNSVGIRLPLEQTRWYRPIPSLTVDNSNYSQLIHLGFSRALGSALHWAQCAGQM